MADIFSVLFFGMHYRSGSVSASEVYILSFFGPTILLPETDVKGDVHPLSPHLHASTDGASCARMVQLSDTIALRISNMGDKGSIIIFFQAIKILKKR